MLKNIYTLWFQGWQQAPKFVQGCRQSWIDKNPTWQVISLHNENLHEYIDMARFNRLKDTKRIHREALSDIIRIELLQTYGGLWVDATCLCVHPLDEWLPTTLGTSTFWAFEKPGRDRLLASWFLYGLSTDHIVQQWFAAVHNYWSERDKRNAYVWFHYLFNELYRKDALVRQQWDATQKRSANGPHILQRPKIPLKMADLKQTPFFKLNWRTKRLRKETLDVLKELELPCDVLEKK